MEPRYNQRPRDWQNMFVISRYFFIYFTIIGVRKIVRYTEVFVRRASLYRGFRQKRFVIPRFSSEEVRYTEVFVRRGSLYRGFRQKRFVISRFQFTDSKN